MLDRRHVLKLGIGATFAGLGAGRIRAQQGESLFSAGRLEGEDEVPAVETDGKGAALFTLADDEEALEYQLLVADIPNVTAAHVHRGGSDENGEVVAPLFGATDAEGNVTGPLEGGLTEDGILAEGTLAAEDLAGPLEGQELDALVGLLRGEDAYVNVHTVDHPEGEIRGQLRPVQSVEVEFQQRLTLGASGGGGSVQRASAVQLSVQQQS